MIIIHFEANCKTWFCPNYYHTPKMSLFQVHLESLLKYRIPWSSDPDVSNAQLLRTLLDWTHWLHHNWLGTLDHLIISIINEKYKKFGNNKGNLQFQFYLVLGWPTQINQNKWIRMGVEKWTLKFFTNFDEVSKLCKALDDDFFFKYMEAT